MNNNNQNQQPYGYQYTQPQPNYYQSNMPNNNKKTKRIIIIVIAIALIVCCGGIGAVIGFVKHLTAPVEPIEMRDFILAMQDMHYENYSSTGDYYNEYHNKDYTTEVSIDDVSTSALASSSLQTFRYLYGYESASTKSSREGPNYEVYRWKADDTFYCTARLENMVLWIRSENRKDVDEILDAVGL